MDKIFVLTQKPYLPKGTLRDQVIYPDSVEEMVGKQVHDNDLYSLLEKVELGYLLERYANTAQGWDTYNEWYDILSGGEKQRIQVARMFYHKP